MPKYQPTVEAIVAALKGSTSNIKTNLQGIFKAKRRLPVSPGEKIISALQELTKRFGASFIAGGKKLISNGGSGYVIYLSPLNGTSLLLPRATFSSCVVTLMQIENSETQCSIGRPICSVIYYPTGKQMWTVEKGKGVQYKDLELNTSISPASFAGKSLPDDTIRIYLANWTKPDDQLKDIRARLNKKDNFVALNCGSTALAAGYLLQDGNGVHGCVSTDKTAADIAALALMMNELGGKVTDLSGQPIDGFSYAEDHTNPEDPKGEFTLPNGAILAINALVHKEIAAAITK